MAPAPRTALAIDRLFWRAGFGPSPAERRRFRREGVRAAVAYLLDPPTRNVLRGPAPRAEDDDDRLGPLRPYDLWGHDVLWWLDRMVRTRAPLVERMTLNLHDHFATSNADVGDPRLMIRQNGLLRRHALGDFGALLHGIVRDPAMQRFLNLLHSHKDAPNENFARELMELFTLGGGYTERDIREASRALTGFAYDWDEKRHYWNADAHDDGVKVVFGRRGRFGPDEVVRLCLEHPRHPGFICRKLWRYLSPVDPPAPTLRSMVRAYTRSGRQIRPVLRVALQSKAFYAHLDEPDMVKPPVVFLVGAMRATGTPVRSRAWSWMLRNMGQAPFYPPNVGGWDDGPAYLSTVSFKARWDAMGHLLRQHEFPDARVPVGETPARALADAQRFCGGPWLSRTGRSGLTRTARSIRPRWDGDRHHQAERRRVLRHLLLAGPDAHVH